MLGVNERHANEGAAVVQGGGLCGRDKRTGKIRERGLAPDEAGGRHGGGGTQGARGPEGAAEGGRGPEERGRHFVMLALAALQVNAVTGNMLDNSDDSRPALGEIQSGIDSSSLV